MKLGSVLGGAATARIVVLGAALGMATAAQAQTSTSLPLAVGLDDAACARAAGCARDRDGTPDHVLPAAIISGAIGATIGYVFGVGIASAQPRFSRADALPVVGALIAAGHNGLNDPASSLLLVSAGVQMMGLLVTIVAATELTAKRRPRLRVSVVPDGAGGASLRF